MSAYDIFLTFDQIGEIYSVEKDADDTFTVYFAELAAPLINASANTNDEPSNRLNANNSAPTIDKLDQTQATTAAIDLNDHCWLEVFERLHVRDLYEVANTCKRFHTIASHVFRAKYKNRPFDNLALIRDDDCDPSLSLYVHTLRTFAPSYICASWDEGDEISIILRTIIEHCTDLEKLSLPDCFSIEPDILADLRPLLCRASSLWIDSEAFLKSYHCANEWQTEQLTIYPVEEFTEHWQHIKLPKLTEVTFTNSVDENNELVHAFLANHPQVKALSFECYTFTQLLSSLPEYVPIIESLSFWNCDVQAIDNESGATVGVFKRLKKCFVGVETSGIVGVLLRLLEGSPIEQLTLSNEGGVESGMIKRIGRLPIESICRLPTITHLIMENVNLNVTHSEWIQLTKALNQLQSLHIERTNISLGSVQRILEQSTKLRELVIYDPSPIGRMEFISAECDAISALIATRPGLSVRIVVAKRNIDVSRTYLFNLTGFFSYG